MIVDSKSGHACNKCQGTGRLHFKPKTNKADSLLYALYEKTRLNPRVSYEFTLTEGWRMDFIEISKSGYMNEFEIKISLSDLKNDFKKLKHAALSRMEVSRVAHGVWGNFSPSLAIPNRFFYVVTKELEEKALELIPPHAGLLVLDGGAWLQQAKNAPFIHKEKASPDLEKAVLLNAAYKARKMFFKLREAKPI